MFAKALFMLPLQLSPDLLTIRIALRI